MRLQGKTAFISGAGRNMGKAIALAFAREGADLILVARTNDYVVDVAKECESLGVQAMAIAADVGYPEEVKRAVAAGLERFGKVDLLTCVAAMRPHTDFWDYANDVWLKVFSVNVHSTFFLAKALAPSMMKRGTGGSIIALGAGSSLTARPRGALEAACKHGLYGLIKALALELGPYGIRANLLALGHMEAVRRNPEWYPLEDGKVHGTPEFDSIALRRRGTADEVAKAALFLASDESSYVTGDRICCMGGLYMRT